MSDMTPTAEERYRLLVEGAKDYAMILLDAEGRITGWNLGAERIMGWTEAEVMGRPADLMFTPEDRAAGVPAREMARARAQGRALDLRWHLKKDGSRFFADGLLESLRDGDGRQHGFSKLLRDATERRRAEEALAESSRLSELAADVGRALTTRDSLAGMLHGCTEALVRHLDAAFARVWTLDAGEAVLVLRASAGLYTHLDGPHGRVPLGQFKIGLIALERRPHLTNAVVGDPRVSDQEWAEREGMVAFAGYPLIVDGRVVGVAALFARHPLSGVTLQALGSVADQIAVGIDRSRTEEALREANQRTTNILESIADAFFALNNEWRFTYVNREAEAIWGRPRASLLGRNVWDEFPEAVGSTFDQQFHGAVADGVTASFEEFYPPLNAWLGVRAYPSSGGLSVYFHDITARKQEEEERERLLAEAEKRAEREALLNRVGEALRASTDPEKIQRAASRALGEALGADRCYFSFYDLSADLNWVGQDFRREDLPSLAGRYRISDFKVNPEDYYPSGRTLLVADATADDWAFPEELLSALRRLRVRSTLTVPIFEGGRLVATLSVAMADEPRAWTNTEVRLAETVAAQTRSAVEAARLLAEQQARLQEEALVGRIGVAIRSERDPEAIQGTAAQLLGEALGVDRCFYLTYDVLGDAATVGRDFRRPDLSSLAGEYRLSNFQQMLAEVFAGGGTAAIPDVRAALSPAVAQAMEAFDHRAVLAVPFFDEGRLVAALWASADGPRTWTAHEAALMEQAATLTRTALEAARVSRKERAIAQQLQEALQPAAPDHVPGLSVGSFTRPALDEASVGGDFYDVFALDKGLYAIVIGDVSGKGLAAAQQLALIRNSLRTTLYLYRAPAQAVTALNTIVTVHDLLVGFVTAFVGVYDAATGQIAYCSCGHEPGLVRRGGYSVIALETTGPPLGVSETAQYGEQTVTLAEGDTLLLYTDGLSEAGPSRRQLLGTEGLSRILVALPEDTAVQAQAESLVGNVSAFANGVFHDDVAVLLARRQG